MQAHELQAGYVVVVGPGDSRQVHHVLAAGVDRYNLSNITFNDGRVMLCSASRDFQVLHPLPESAAPASESS